MTTIEWVVVILLGLLALGMVSYMAYRRFRVHPVLRRIQDLSWEQRMKLAGRLFTDREIPLPTRAILVVLILYLALPIDFIPDFIPVIGQIDDVMILGGGLLLFARLVPRERLDHHIAMVEAGQPQVIDVESRPADEGSPPGGTLNSGQD